ncbi:AAA family ATPase [Paenibacillus athensensis]|uniref:ATPase AAA-type core domain-containing protein n=1 Tax=Paenibacillus athensensis TaxID=1967502 RepID=A0A4Y8Q2S2_9BACL|nr:AAA family ATPase [Paenibacillus athensensis]MCD1261007.1 AAA family ATPase [Paenibacillus athensensis]
MELCYLWIEQYRDGSLREQGLIFDQRYRYALKTDDNGVYTLQVKANSYDLRDFFRVGDEPGPALVGQVTAIVGENGAGKSTILDYIKERLVDREQLSDEALAESRFVYVLRERGEEGDLHRIYRHPALRLEVQKAEGTEFAAERPVSLEPGAIVNLQHTRFVFLSNVYDGKREPAGPNLLNVSTNYLVDEKRRSDAAPIPREGSRHRFGDVKRQVLFSQFVGNHRLPFDTPRQLQVYINRSAHWSRLNEPRYRNYPLAQSIITLSNAFVEQRAAAAKREPDNSHLYFLRFMLEHLTDELLASPFFLQFVDIDVPKRPVVVPHPDFVPAPVPLADFEYLLEELFTALRMHHYADTLELTALFEPMLGLTRMLYKQLSESPLKFDDNQTPYFMLDLDKLGNAGVQEFLGLCEAASGEHELFRFMWRDLSSGQKALFNIYSRLHYVAGFIREEAPLDVVLLIDEGDIYMHPHWQQQFIDNLLQMLPHLFDPSNRKVQLVLTSNSPFVVSDLPNASVIYLQRSADGCRVLDSLDEQPQTFAANIHTLLAHSFFMQEGLIGAFAKRKINEVIHVLVHESAQVAYEQRERLETVLNMIGEPVIRHKIAQMLRDKLAVRDFGVEREIASLKLRLDELERWQRDQNRAN